MIKSVSWFPLQCANNSPPVIQALLTSLHANGIDIKENSLDADAVILWSVLWNGRMAPNKPIYEHYKLYNRPVIVIDVGGLQRNVTWKIAIDNVNALGYFGNTQNLDLDRPHKLGIHLKTTHVGSEILIAGQHGLSLQVAHMTSQESWITDQIIKLQKYTDRVIRVRSHPRSMLKTHLLPKDIILERPQRVHTTYDDFDFTTAYHAIVNYSSTPGILAGINGTRPIVSDASLAYPVSVEASNIEKSYTADRDKWLIELCHTEYLLEEIEQGLWLKRLSDKL